MKINKSFHLIFNFYDISSVWPQWMGENPLKKVYDLVYTFLYKQPVYKLLGLGW